jgi:uncharacterized protein (TIGR02678 family)
MAGDPQAAVERRAAARHLVQRPLTCLEHDPDVFRLVRRHEAELDRWFTQRLGYRLHVDADTARLFKTTTLIGNRPLRAGTGRPFHQLEYVLLALVLASTAAGPAVISLRDLVDKVRSAAAEADIRLAGDTTERRALVAVLRWMIDHGLASELHAHVDAYADDREADAVLKVRPDRIVLLPLPTLVGADDAVALLERSDRRSVASRQWMRCRLVEDPVLFRHDLTAAEWGELRRRLGEEERILDEMFDLVIEARAEGVAAIDPSGNLASLRFPKGGTEGHAALLLLDTLPSAPASAGGDGVTAPAVSWSELVETVRRLTEQHARRWSKDLVAAPDKLARNVVELLVEVRLAERVPLGPPADDTGDAGDAEPGVRLLPAAARFRAVARAQESLW